MNRYVPLFILMLSFHASIKTVAQSTPSSNNTLLWRISGKGLARNSFLYGTMHLQDKRLFYFGDSLYHYLEQSDGYAMEVDLKEMMDSVMQHIIDKKQDEISDRKFSSNKSKSKTIDSLLANVKFHNDKVSKRELKKLRDEKMRKALKNKEMPTIMDAYLYNIAKRSGKWLGGIEDIADQLPLIDELGGEISKEELMAPDKEVANYLEKMIKIYLDQDLQLLDQFTNNNSSEDYRDRLLLKRNVKMASRMDSLSHIRSTFFAIGAAHLPGDSGVISLLRKKGYDVSPVFSSQKLDPDVYAPKLSELPWISVEDLDKYYKVDMPAAPSDMDMLSGAMKVKLCMDMSSLTFYMSGNAFAQKNIDFTELVKSVPKNMGGELVSHKSIEENGASGVECVVATSGYYFKIKYLLKDSRLYLVMAGGEKKEKLEQSDITKFFKSFTINEDRPMDHAYQWRPFTIENKGFTIEVPATMKINKGIEKQADGTNWNFKVYDYADAQTGSFLMIQVRDVKSGNYISNDSTYFREYSKSLKEFADRIIMDSVVKFESFPAFRFEGDDQKTSVRFKMLSVNRGNRVYNIYGGGSNEGKGQEMVTRFINSFHLTPYEYSPFKKETHDNFSVLVPGILEAHAPDSLSTSTLKNEHYTSFNPVDNISYELYKDEISHFYYAKNDSVFFEKMGDDFRSRDSVVSRKWVVNGDIKGMEWITSSHNSQNLKIFRQLLNGDTLITLSAHVPENYINSEQCLQFFTSFRIANEDHRSTIFTRKHRQLLRDLSSSDSVTLVTASAAIDGAEFSEDELPLLYEALMKNYPGDSIGGNATRQSIGEAIVQLPAASTLSFIQANYKTLGGEQESLKFDFVDILSQLKTKESFSLIKEILLGNPPIVQSEQALSYRIDDSLQLTVQLFPELLQLTNNPVLSKRIMAISSRLLDSNMISLEMLRPYERNYIHFMDSLAEELKKLAPDDYNEYAALDILNVIKHFNNSEANRILRKYLALENIDFKMRAALLLLKNKQSVSNISLEQIAADRAYRRDLYNGLKEIDNVKLYPKKYLTQQLFAEADMHVYTYDDEEPATFKFLGVKTALYKGTKQKFYLFRIDYESLDEDETKQTESYLGIAGPYSADASDIGTNDNCLGIYFKEPFDVKNVDEQFKLFLIERKDYDEGHAN